MTVPDHSFRFGVVAPQARSADGWVLVVERLAGR